MADAIEAASAASCGCEKALHLMDQEEVGAGCSDGCRLGAFHTVPSRVPRG